jgi:AhpD family alkylhydroperoxidase
MQATYEAFKAPFNANSFMKTTLNALEVEAISIAVSSDNNCHQCVGGHIKKGLDLGLTHEQHDECIRVGAVTAAAGQAIAALAPARHIETAIT